MRGIDDAHREAQEDQRKQRVFFRFFERHLGMITRYQMRDRGERIFFVQSYIGARNGELADGRCVVQIAEIDDRPNLVSLNHNVVIVGVAVNHAMAQRSQIRSHRENFFDQSRIGSQMQVIADPKSAFQVPFKLPMRA